MHHGIEFLVRDEEAKQKWWVKCHCGNKFKVEPYKIISKKKKSCGCLTKSSLQPGDIFNGMELIEHLEPNKPKSKSSWKILCYCGKVFTGLAQNVYSGATKSCGCSRFSHSGSNTRLYSIWLNMRRRCSETTNIHYEHYGGKGIKVCDAWNEDFSSFRDWSLLNGYSEKLTIDRIDGDKNYEPSNCRWAGKTLQARNKKANRKSKSGILGVTWNKKEKKWHSRISVGKDSFHLGTHIELKEAIEARREAEIKYWGEEYQDFNTILNDLEELE